MPSLFLCVLLHRAVATAAADEGSVAAATASQRVEFRKVTLEGGGTIHTLVYDGALIRGLSIEEPDQIAKDVDGAPWAASERLQKFEAQGPPKVRHLKRIAKHAKDEGLEGEDLNAYVEGEFSRRHYVDGGAAAELTRVAREDFPKMNAVRIPIKPGGVPKKLRLGKADGFCRVHAALDGVDRAIAVGIERVYLSRLVDPVLRAAAAEDLLVMLDWHYVAEGVKGYDEKSSRWAKDGYAAFAPCTDAFWQVASALYGEGAKRPEGLGDVVVLPEVFNEPWYGRAAEDIREWEAWDTFTTKSLKEVRFEHPAVVGGPDWSAPRNMGDQASAVRDATAEKPRVQAYHVYADQVCSLATNREEAKAGGKWSPPGCPSGPDASSAHPSYGAVFDHLAGPVFVTEYLTQEEQLQSGDADNDHASADAPRRELASAGKLRVPGDVLADTLRCYSWIAWTYSVGGPEADGVARNAPALLWQRADGDRSKIDPKLGFSHFGQLLRDDSTLWDRQPAQCAGSPAPP